MPTKEPSGVGQRENTHQAAALGDKRAADVLRRQTIEHAIERLTDVDDVGIRNEDIADEQLLFRRQSKAGISARLRSQSVSTPTSVLPSFTGR